MVARAQIGVVGLRLRRGLRARRDQKARAHAPGQGGRPHAPHPDARGARRAGALAYRGSPKVDRLVAAAVKAPAALRPDDRRRRPPYRLAGPDAAALVDAFAHVPCAYVADGHHRSAGARRAAAERRGRDRRDVGAEHEWFPAALCPADQLAILPYHRLVRDLGGLTAAEVLARLGRAGRLSPAAGPRRLGAGSFCIYLERRWHLLELAPASVDRADPLRSLDVWLLGERVLGPVLGITDQGTDARHRLRGRHPGDAGARGARRLPERPRSPSRCSRRRWSSSWPSPMRAPSCRRRARGSSPSCSAAFSSIRSIEGS